MSAHRDMEATHAYIEKTCCNSYVHVWSLVSGVVNGETILLIFAGFAAQHLVLSFTLLNSTRNSTKTSHGMASTIRYGQFVTSILRLSQVSIRHTPFERVTTD